MDASENESTSQQEEEDVAPIALSYNNEHQRRLDDLLERQQLSPAVPTIVLVGERCSGKSSLVASLIEIKMPLEGCFPTGVPVIIKLQNHQCPEPQFSLEYDGTMREAGRITKDDHDQWSVAFEISQATYAIAGIENEISNKPLTLILKKHGFPNLTIVDLPGITHDRESSSYKQIREMIMEYITPEDRIILNVIEARLDPLPDFESINMSKKVDDKGGRTLVVVTKAENVPYQGLLNALVLDKVTEMKLNYVCIRNNIGFESFRESKSAEATFFETHPLLSKIKKCSVSIPVLAHKLWLTQAKNTCTDIVRNINNKHNAYVTDLKKLPRTFSSVDEGLREVTRLLSSAKRSLHTILLRGELVDDQECNTARIIEMLDHYSAQLHLMDPGKKEDFMMDEIMYIEKRMEARLPIDFLDVVRDKVSGISKMAEEFVGKMWNNIESVVVEVLMHHFYSYPKLQDFTRRVVHRLITKKMDASVIWVREIAGTERLADYTCNPYYVASCSRLLAQKTTFMEIMTNPKKCSIINLEGIGEVDVGHLRKHVGVARQAFELKMKMIAYWKILLIRLMDFMALPMISTIQNIVKNDIEEYIASALLTTYGDDSGIKKILEESSEIAKKRERLNTNVELLEKSKKEVEKIKWGICGESFKLLFGYLGLGPMSNNPSISAFMSWFLST